MKITMYELLGLVKDGKAPKKIIYDGSVWKYKEETYYSNNICIYDWCNMMNVLNDTVEIPEEEKKIPEKISLEIDKFEDSYYDTALIKVASKIDELIDYLDYLNSKGE